MPVAALKHRDFVAVQGTKRAIYFGEPTYLSKTEYADATSDSAQRKAQSLVTRFHGQVDGVFCPNESSTSGMLRALEGAGMLPVGP